ncbi:MAG: valine--pyruvate transaminase [Lentisphaeria bacterium]|nr:valine--pyruvate transaminase [Lentisphaeria bacterium]
MKLSRFGTKFTERIGINELMEDLGNALNAGGDMLMLGGGNPSLIPEITDALRKQTESILADGDAFSRMIGIYDTPQGKGAFLEALARLLNEQFNWGVTTENIALTHGSQSGFFCLFNMLAGTFDSGRKKRVLFPLTPEYIGYADSGLSPDFFTAARPDIDLLAESLFKYRIDFNAVDIDDSVGAVCLSRPTNPTGNVVTDEEVATLRALTEKQGIPLIIDSAYGTPFPNIIYTEANPVWDENMIVCMSLSKFGLPAARTGIVVARREIIKVLSSMTAVLSLAPGSVGPVLAQGLIADHSIIRLSREVIRPYYERKAHSAVRQLTQELAGINFRIHKPEGAMFLWLWFPDLPITCDELYQRLKKRGVLVVPGHYFFPGLQEDWPHKHQCLRVTYAQDDTIVEKGLAIIADEVKSLMA